MIRGLVGGSFDPVHRGHVALVARLLAPDLADRVAVIPAARSPHKPAPGVTAEHRLRMCEMAFAPLIGVHVDRCEIDRSAPSYTVDTLEHYRREFPDDRLLLAVGADLLAGFRSWKRPDDILALARLVVFSRSGIRATRKACEAADIPVARTVLVPEFDHGVSSTTVRAILADGDLPKDELTPEVAAYIRERGLYGPSEST